MKSLSICLLDFFLKLFGNWNCRIIWMISFGKFFVMSFNIFFGIPFGNLFENFFDNSFGNCNQLSEFIGNYFGYSYRYSLENSLKCLTISSKKLFFWKLIFFKNWVVIIVEFSDTNSLLIQQCLCRFLLQFVLVILSVMSLGFLPAISLEFFGPPLSNETNP